MNNNGSSRLPDVLSKCQSRILADWIGEQTAILSRRRGAQLKEAELREQSGEFLSGLTQAAQSGNIENTASPAWAGVREFLGNLTRSRARQGYTPVETASFVFSLKQPIFACLREELGNNTESLATETWNANLLLDQLGLYTTEVYQQTREEVIGRQQQEMLELSTPVVRLWEGVLALPLIGTLDSERTQVVMESLLQRIVETGATIAIIDITGVPTVDTLVAQHLLKTVAAARLMGADCIISGIRPQIAQTIVHLGVELTDVVTKATLADAFALALKRNGLGVRPVQARAVER